MNESSSTSQSATAMFGGAQAIWLGFALLAGLGLMLGLAAFDKGRRSSLERMEETTAVGDKSFFVPPADPANSPVIVLSVDGQTIEVAAGERHKLRDTRMRRLGRDEVNHVAIYEYLPPPSKDGGTAPVADGHYYVKIAPGEYLRAPRPGKR